MKRRWVAAVALVLTVSSGAAPAAGVDLSKENSARAFARRSHAPLSAGIRDCVAISSHYPTLGAAVRWHEKRANVENKLSCKRAERHWACTASFMYKHENESETEWTLFLEFSVDDTGKVAGLDCSAAG
jgi:hypothetical protein